MKVYLICEEVDLGYNVLEVYSKFSIIPYSLSPMYSYKYTGKPFYSSLVPDKIIEGQWDIQGEYTSKRFVLQMDVITKGE